MKWLDYLCYWVFPKDSERQGGMRKSLRVDFSKHICVSSLDKLKITNQRVWRGGVQVSQPYLREGMHYEMA